jgi:hypothetical protein
MLRVAGVAFWAGTANVFRQTWPEQVHSARMFHFVSDPGFEYKFDTAYRAFVKLSPGGDSEASASRPRAAGSPKMPRASEPTTCRHDSDLYTVAHTLHICSKLCMCPEPDVFAETHA